QRGLSAPREAARARTGGVALSSQWPQAPHDIRISDGMKDRHHEEITGSPVQDPEEQTDGENGGEHRQREGGPGSEVGPVQRAEGVEHVRDEDAGESTPTANQLELDHPAVHELLVEPEKEVGYEHTQEARGHAGLRKAASDRRREHDR